MAQETYTLEQCEADLATLRGQVDLLSEVLTLDGWAGPPNTPAGAAVLWADALNNVERIMPSGRTAQLTDGQGNVSSHTITANNVITDGWAVPAYDSQVSTAYRLTAWGTGTQAATPTTLQMAGNFGSTNYAAAVSGTGFAAGGAAFTWKAEIIFICVTTGAGGTCVVSMSAQIRSGTTSTTLVGEQTGIAFDTTASRTFYMSATFGAAASLTCDGSLFERLGA